MTTIFDSAAPVKSAQNFGSMPARERRMPYTLADLDWAAQAFGDAEADRRLDEQAPQVPPAMASSTTPSPSGHCPLW